MEAVDVGEVSIPVGHVCDYHQVDQDGEELVGSDSFLCGVWRPSGEGGDGVAEAVELLQGCGELVQLREDSTSFWQQQP